MLVRHKIKLKKVIIITLISLLLVSAPFIIAAAVDDTPIFDGILVRNGVLTKCSQSLSNVEIPYGVTSIGDKAFQNCTNLTTLTIPDSVIEIGDWAFAGCVNLTNITIPDSVTSIGFATFAGCTNLTNITIPDSITSISGLAFYDCRSLTSIMIPNSNTNISDWTFYGCTNLSNVTINNGVTRIGYEAFYGCINLTHITIPNSVITLCSGVFRGCINLTNIIIGNGVTYIGEDPNSHILSQYFETSGTSDFTFYYCAETNYTQNDWDEVGTDLSEYDTSVTNKGGNAFYGCTSLTNIIVDEDNAYYKSIDGNLYTKDGSDLVMYAIGKNATSFTIPDSVTSIGDFAFYGSTSLISVSMPNCVASIGESAFEDCKSLTNITIPISVTSLGDNVFKNCLNLVIYFEVESETYFHNNWNPDQRPVVWG